MKSFLSSLLRYAQDVVSREHLLTQESAAEKIKLIRFLCRKAANGQRVDQLSDEDQEYVRQWLAEKKKPDSASRTTTARRVIRSGKPFASKYRASQSETAMAQKSTASVK